MSWSTLSFTILYFLGVTPLAVVALSQDIPVRMRVAPSQPDAPPPNRPPPEAQAIFVQLTCAPRATSMTLAVSCVNRPLAAPEANDFRVHQPRTWYSCSSILARCPHDINPFPIL